jgi:O-antigen ligase
MKPKASRARDVKFVGTITEKMTLINHLFSADRASIQLWCKMGILFSLAIYISQIPFPKDNASVKSLSLAVVAVLWIARLILERRFTFIRTRLWWPVIIFTVITILSVIVSINVDYSLRNIKKYTFISVFLFFAIVNNVRDLKDVKILLLALMISTGVFSLLALIDYFLFEPSFGSRLSFRYLDKNLGRFSVFYDIVIPINLALIFITKDKIKRVLFGLVFLLSITTIFFMQMRASYLVIFLSLLAITFVYRKKLFVFMLIIPFLVAIMMPTNMVTRAREMFKFGDYMKSDGVLNYRIDTWKGAVRIIKENPALGLGVGKSNFGKTVKKFNDLNIPYDHAHNIYLQIAVELGLLGLAAFLWLFGSVFYHGLKHYLSLPRNDEKAILIFGILCSIGGLFLHGLIAYFYKHEGFYTLWVAVALLFALIEGNAEKSHSSCAPALSPS